MVVETGTNDFIQDLAKSAFQEIMKPKTEEPTEEAKTEGEATTTATKKSLLDLKKEFAQKYVQKIDKEGKLKVDVLTNIFGGVADFLVEEDMMDQIKDKFREKQLKEEVDTDTMQRLQETKDRLADVSTEDALLTLESEILWIKQDPKKEKTETPTVVAAVAAVPVVAAAKEKTDTKIDNPDKPDRNMKYIVETNYVQNVADKETDTKIKENIIKYGPLVIEEAQKYPQTKDIIPLIFGQIKQESGRNEKAANTKGENSHGFMQINKKAWHTGEITTPNGDKENFDIDTPEGNIKYGIAYLANCIKEYSGNVEHGFDRYNGVGNFAKAESQRYSAHIIENAENYMAA